MPSLVIHQGVLPDQDEILGHIEKALAAGPAAEIKLPGYNPSARRWMWAGVVTMTVAIVSLWGWSMTFQLSALKLSGPEKKFIQKTETSWSQTFASAASTSSEAVKAEVQTKISELVAGFNATSSPSTSAAATTNTLATPGSTAGN